MVTNDHRNLHSIKPSPTQTKVFSNCMTNFVIILISNLTLFNKIKLNKMNMADKNILINCNHTGSIDDLLVMVVLKQIFNKYDFSSVLNPK